MSNSLFIIIRLTFHYYFNISIQTYYKKKLEICLQNYIQRFQQQNTE